MNKKTVIFITLTFLAITIVGLLIYKMPKRKPSVIWKESYKSDDKNPYGGFLAFELLKERFKNQSFDTLSSSVANFLDTADFKGTYFFIGPDLYWDEDDLDRINKFVREGNTAFISVKSFVYDELTYSESDQSNCAHFQLMWSHLDTILANFYDSSLTIDSNYLTTYNRPAWNKINYSDYYIELDSCSLAMELGYCVSLGRNQTNFVKIPIGSGVIFLHSQPMLFSNSFLKTSEGLDYFEKITSYLPDHSLLWDQVSKMPYMKDRAEAKSPLIYILSQPSLSWAWYLLIVLGILYLLFNFKRIQRPIPVLPLPENTSKEYIMTLGNVYLQTKRHDKLMAMKLKLFFEEMKIRFRLTNEPWSVPWTNELVARTKIELNEFQKLKNRINDLEFKGEAVTGNDLFLLAQHIDKIRNRINSN